ncbi:MAG: toll/interleukin-1 receptor domain-containing protein [Bacteroidetes bacterium]|nr:toll/interleukin-1 receptor domain-containing protein [Bacteroidota bacterium]
MTEQRTVLFISHAFPEDNYFAAWLSSKLNLLGYETWLDLDDISAGDSFYTEIEPIIRQKAMRFIAVSSKAYVKKARIVQTGVNRELDTARTVKGVDKFFLPVRCDEVSFDDFPMHYSSLDAIDFHGNWGNGLLELVEQLEKKGIPKRDEPINPLGNWFRSIASTSVSFERTERYRSNWLPLQLPAKVYVHSLHEPINKAQVWQIPYPKLLVAKYLISFFPADVARRFVEVIATTEVPTEDFKGDDALLLVDGGELRNPKSKLIDLLNRSFAHRLRLAGLIHHKDRDTFYFRRNADRDEVISLKHFGKRSRQVTGIKTVSIGGKKILVNWHYSLTASASLHPLPIFRLHYSLVFTDQRFRRFDDALSQTLRRKVPSDWYNRRWLETMLAAILKLATPDGVSIEVDVGGKNRLVISTMPVTAESPMGYFEPSAINAD